MNKINFISIKDSFVDIKSEFTSSNYGACALKALGTILGTGFRTSCQRFSLAHADYKDGKYSSFTGHAATAILQIFPIIGGISACIDRFLHSTEDNQARKKSTDTASIIVTSPEPSVGSTKDPLPNRELPDSPLITVTTTQTPAVSTHPLPIVPITNNRFPLSIRVGGSIRLVGMLYFPPKILASIRGGIEQDETSSRRSSESSSTSTKEDDETSSRRSSASSQDSDVSPTSTGSIFVQMMTKSMGEQTQIIDLGSAGLPPSIREIFKKKQGAGGSN